MAGLGSAWPLIAAVRHETERNSCIPPPSVAAAYVCWTRRQPGTIGWQPMGSGVSDARVQCLLSDFAAAVRIRKEDSGCGVSGCDPLSEMQR